MTSLPQSMAVRDSATVVREGGARVDVAAFVELTKPRLVLMVLLTTAAGYYLGSPAALDPLGFCLTLFGAGLAAAGSLALNEYLEREPDSLMRRTLARPIPSGRVDAADALGFGAALTAVGLCVLSLGVNSLSGLVTAVTVVSYLGLYTPLKRRTSLCSIVGAVPGALPPVTGWVAATGSVDAGALALFCILFFWQLPHSLAIAKLYRDDYERAGFQLLPTVDREGGSTERQIAVHCASLLVAGMVPGALGICGPIYVCTAFVMGLGMLGIAAMLLIRTTEVWVRRMLVATLIYLPVLLGVMVLDRTPV